MRRYGGPEATEPAEMPAPTPRGVELLVRVHAAGLNPVDFETREGKLRVIRRYRFPQVMGNELAGVVEAVGSGVTRFAPGDRIYARVDKDVLGAFAELAVVQEAHAAAMPTSLDFAHAAA